MYTFQRLEKYAAGGKCYARSLWHVLTGETIQIPIDIQGGQGRSRETQETKSQDVACTLAPNPANDEIRVMIHDFEAGDKEITIEAFDITGQRVFAERSMGKNQVLINSERWKDGVYLIKVIADNEELLNQKIVIGH